MDKLRVVFISNFLSLHQIEICKEFLKYDFIDFFFISSYGPSGEKHKLGNYETLDFVIRAYENQVEFERAKRITNESDVILFGSGNRDLITNPNKLIFFYSEHFSKDNLTLLRSIHIHFIYKKYKNSYLLCASSYAKRDFNRALLFKNRCFKYGYFPNVGKNNIENIRPTPSFLWIGRDLSWKRLEDAFLFVKYYSISNPNFVFTVVSKNNKTFKKLAGKYKNEGFLKNIHIIEDLSHENVLKLMNTSDYFLFTSSKGEGWGAVLNEAMSQGSICVASSKAGSTNFLISDGYNGFKYKNKKELIELAKNLNVLSNNSIKQRASDYIFNNWTAEIAVQNLINLFICVTNKNIDGFELFDIPANQPGAKL